MDSLKQTVYQVVLEYAKDGLNCQSYLTRSDDGMVLTVIDVEHTPQKHEMDVSVVVHIVGDHVAIERDTNDKLVVDALMQAGVPRSKIVLAYAGESLPETV